MDSVKDRFQGCLLGLALGDALNAPFEGGVFERLLWRVIGRTKSGEMRWTDDTQMSIDVIESLVARGNVDPDDLAARFAGSYRWSRGYGPGTAKVLKRIAKGEPWQRANTAVHRDGSFGNGAAMRAPAIGLFFAERTAELDDAVRRSAIVTHAHALGIDGAVLIARATAAVARAESSAAVLQTAYDGCAPGVMRTRLAIANRWLISRANARPAEVVRELGNGIAAVDSCVTALYLALRFRDLDFIEMQEMAATLRGDTDTIGAMAGAIWGASNGILAMPSVLLERLEQRVRLLSLAETLCQRATEGWTT